jgi:poly(A) polymerase
VDTHTTITLGPDKHNIDNSLVDPNALKVIRDLKQAGFEAFIVGGGVRDLLLGMRPKDFDVATDATPEEIAEVVRRSRIIGRRFKLVHARFGRDIIEVATFRSANTEDDEHSENGMLMNDNVFGTIEEDAARRDFTINALYYDPENHTIHDYVGGLDDLDRKQLRVIGDPVKRFKEDPARMLRLSRLQAKLDLGIEKETLKALDELGDQLTSISSARMFDEVNKVFLSGHAEKSLRALQEHNLFNVLFPATAKSIGETPWAIPMLEAACRNTDLRISQGKPVTPAFLYAVILWPAVEREREKLTRSGLPPVNAMIKAGGRVVGSQQPITSIPRRHSTTMKEIWDLQLRLPKRAGKRAEKILAHQRFRAAYDFLLLREESGEVPVPADKQGLGEWWTQYQDASMADRKKMSQKLGGGKPQHRNRNRRKKK